MEQYTRRKSKLSHHQSLSQRSQFMTNMSGQPTATRFSIKISDLVTPSRPESDKLSGKWHKRNERELSQRQDAKWEHCIEVIKRFFEGVKDSREDLGSFPFSLSHQFRILSFLTILCPTTVINLAMFRLCLRITTRHD